MFKKFTLYLTKLFLKKIVIVSSVFLSLVVILNLLEEVNFFKNLNADFHFPIVMSLLNAPSALFEIFPFIFLISTQFFFLSLINNNELETIKIHGISNMKIIKILFLVSMLVGTILITFFYHFSSQLKFTYLQLKNNYSTDNKYLAAVNENGLWIKDEIEDKIYIINASTIDGAYLKNVSITEFDRNFQLTQIIQSQEVYISNKKWIISDPIISKNNITESQKTNLNIVTHFDFEKINNMFSNLSSLDLVRLFKLYNEYRLLSYSTVEIELYLLKIFSFPFYLSIMTVFTAVIMLNIKRDKTKIFHLIAGIFLSVIIYFFNDLFNLLGKNNKIPILASIWLPLFILTILISIGLVKINEK